ncbi:MAG: hypothetical protein ACXABO_01490 [Promethearchaeota archaeon]
MTNICFLSVLYYASAIKAQKIERKKLEEGIYDFYFDDQSFLGTSYQVIYIDTVDNSKIIEFTGIFNELSKNYNEILYIACFASVFVSLDVLVFFKYYSTNITPKVHASLEIEKVRVTEEEFKVFNLIQEFLNHNRVFCKEKAGSYIKSRNTANCNLNYTGIKTIINSLQKKNLIVEGSKLTRRTVLLNTNRRLMLKLIGENPGIHMNKLSKKLNICPYVSKWHLSMLLRFNLIREQNLNNRKGYFESSLIPGNDRVLQTISLEKCRNIVEFLKINNKGCTKHQISKSLHMHHNTTTKYLNKLGTFNLLVRKKINQKELLYLNRVRFEELSERIKSYNLN